MMGNKKKKDVDQGKGKEKNEPLNNSSSSSEDESLSDFDDEDSGNPSDHELVNVDFEFEEVKEDDFHGLKNLLNTYCDGKQWDLSGFVDLILAEKGVGTVIKTDEDSVFCISTVLHLSAHKDLQCIRDIRQFLLDSGPDDDRVSFLKSFFDAKSNVGLLICERVVNLPHQLLPPLYDILFDEVSSVAKDKESFQWFLMLTRIYQDIPKCKKSTKKKKKKRKKSSEGSNNNNNHVEELVYIKPEDEIFHQLCSWSFTFPVDVAKLAPHEQSDLRPMRLVMAVEAEKIKSFQAQLKTLIDQQ